MIDSFEWGLFLGILGSIYLIWIVLLVYIPIFYLYNRFIDRNAIYAEGFLKYYFLGYVIVFILFECYIALYVPFDSHFLFFDEDAPIYYPTAWKYARLNLFFSMYIIAYLIGIPIALYLTKLVNKLHKTDKTPQILHRGKTIIFGILAPILLMLCCESTILAIDKATKEIFR
ncbi:hypothetical protein [Helicobacter rodentium]|uniref:hypothetical protein n=1 Tax=Helicobacter rodentium TaxID=59617 RepID=UPI0023F0ADA7|nr:hypothetical protein [Helicobacter rodentium]